MPELRFAAGLRTLTPAARSGALPTLLATAIVTVLLTSGTQTAVANGDTRTISLYHSHTKESIQATFRVNGQYDAAALKQLNWFLRDWRRDEPINMDPRLFDTLWEVYRGAGASNQEITVVSAYRSPQTNAMLRRRSRAVAEHSQHMLGKAMDTTMPGMSMAQVRETGMKLQRGGVGYYPTAGTPFVHLDVGSVRSWPRMGYDQLARLFPDGKTVHLPANGQPLARYEEARAELEANGGYSYATVAQASSKGFFATLFGSGEDDEEVAPIRSRGGRRTQVASLPSRGAQVYSGGSGNAGVGDDGGRNFFVAETNARNAPVARAERNLPRGETYIAAPAAPAAPPQAAPAQPAPVQVAALAPAAQAPAKPQPLPETADADAPEAITASARNIPLPPRRPGDLVIIADAPLPPARPVEFAMARATVSAPVMTDATAYAPDPALRRDPIGQLAAANDATSAIRAIDKTGSVPTPPARAVAASALATLMPIPGLRAALTGRGKPVVEAKAVVAVPADPAKAPIMPARLDRSNFRALTGSEPATTMTTQSVMGSNVTAPRRAARAASDLLAAETNGTTKFGAIATNLPTGSFAKVR